jgi:L-seryl-tRNA(Ser) seleniumtransferase
LTGPLPPVPAALASRRDDLRRRAERIAASVGDPRVVAAESLGRVGGGGAPGVTLPSAAVVLPVDTAAALRTGPAPVMGHVHDGRLWLDLLAVPPELDATIVSAVRAVLTGGG